VGPVAPALARGGASPPDDPRPRIIRQKKAHPRELEERLIDRLELVRQGVHPGDRQPEVGIEFIGDSQGIGLQPEAEEVAIALVGVADRMDTEGLEVLEGEGNPSEPLGPDADQADRPEPRSISRDRLHPHRLVKLRSGKDLPFLD